MRVFVVTAVLVLTTFDAAWCGSPGTVKVESIERLDVRTSPLGGVSAHATVHLPASPSVIQMLLEDYEHWPELFTVQMRMAGIERRPDRVITDMRLRHGLLGGERRLVCENRELPTGGLRTTLLGGDFKRYSRTWRLAPDGDAAKTKAEFELDLQVDTWAPDWIVASVLKGELESHFHILGSKALSWANRVATP